MKITAKQSAATFLFILILPLVSCIKKPADVIPPASEIHGEEISPNEEPAVPIETLAEAKILSPKANLCLLGRDGKMHGILNLSYGDNVEVIFIDGQIVTMQSEDMVYAHSVYNQVEYWMDMDSIALQCQNALVVEKAVLYADKDFLLTTDEKNSPFRFGDSVCRSTKEEDESEYYDRIYYYDRNVKKVKSAFVKKGCLSTRVDDIVVMDCVKKLRITKRATPRNEIFKKAAKYNPCPRVAAALEAEKTEKIENNYQDVLNALPGAKYKVNVPELLTVDQSKDPFQ